MPDHALVVRHIDAAQPQRAAGREAVRIVADPNACGERGGGSFGGRF
ncbi:MAG TPA: hypothetical protein VJ783_28690 [Pirellulales bacterium]|nr:hypothetical protein [Pirellulales bacterium]